MFNYYEYINIILFIIICLILAIIIFLMNFLLQNSSKPSLEKLSAYECGFYPFSDYQVNFDIQFYFIAILFLVFDIEIVFLFPWVICLKYLTILGFWSMIIFIFILFLGFYYEWKQNLLNWT